VKASARLVAEARARGGTRLTTLVSQAPLLLRQTAGADAAHVQLVGGAAGPIGGDELHLSVHVAARARLCVGSVAASIALPGRRPAESSLEISVRIDEGASLTWSPQPLIVAEGAVHRTTVRVRMADDARMVWHEQTILGRHREQSGSATTRIRVVRAAGVLFDHAFAAGPAHPGSLGPAVAGTHRASATTVVVDPAWSDVAPAERLAATVRDDPLGALAVLPVDGPCVVIAALAPDGFALRALRLPRAGGLGWASGARGGVESVDRAEQPETWGDSQPSHSSVLL